MPKLKTKALQKKDLSLPRQVKLKCRKLEKDTA